jgi:hypothetical protein
MTWHILLVNIVDPININIPAMMKVRRISEWIPWAKTAALKFCGTHQYAVSKVANAKASTPCLLATRLIL